MSSHAISNGYAHHAPQPSADAGPTLITGGAGFIGTNLADRLLARGEAVLLYDNLARRGVERNMRYLRDTYGERARFIHADVRDQDALREAVQGVRQVFHFAGQVAVTTSVAEPLDDFSVNAAGTLYLLEALRALPTPPPLLFTSTNKVYGSLSDIAMQANNLRYEPVDERLRAEGVSEDRPLDFHSPYGCSKGAADQYVLDYARTFGLRAAVFRMSCIYGPHQYGNEDQGWVAHCLISAINEQTITIFGDGKQVRDVLFVDDLVDALLLAQTHMDTITGRAFNIGGSSANTISLLELMDQIETLHGTPPQVQHDAWRPGDQRFYVSNPGAFSAATGWQPRTDVATGVRALYEWLIEAHERANVVSGGVLR